MKKISLGILCFTLILGVSSTRAEPLPPGVIGPYNHPSREAFNAKIIVIGKVASIEKDLVEVSLFPPKGKVIQKTPLRIATVKITETLYGRKGLTEVKLGYVAAAGLPRAARGLIVPEIKEGEEGCFMLVPHHEGDFYIYAGQFTAGPIITKSPPAVAERELNTVRTIAKVMKDPDSFLKSKEAVERAYALNILAKNTPIPDGKQVERTKEETGLLLDLLVEIPYRPSDNFIVGKNELFHALLGENVVKLKFQLPLLKIGENSDESANNAMNEFVKKNREQIVLKKWVTK